MIDLQTLIQLALAGDPQALLMIQQMQMPQAVRGDVSPVAAAVTRTRQLGGENLGTDDITQDVSHTNGFKSSDSTKLAAHRNPQQQLPRHTVGDSIEGKEDYIRDLLKPKTSGRTVKQVVDYRG